MPRKPRFNLTEIPQHIIQRGNNREPKEKGDRFILRKKGRKPGQRTIVSNISVR